MVTTKEKKEMKINDLKIGNYVKHKHEGIICITGMVDDPKGLIRDDKGDWLWFKHAKAIRITRDWMRKLGFMHIGDIAEWELKIHGIVEEITIGVDFQKKGKYVFAVCVHDDQSNNLIHPEVTEVHELQNLIVAVATGSSILTKGKKVW